MIFVKYYFIQVVAFKKSDIFLHLTKVGRFVYMYMKSMFLFPFHSAFDQVQL